MQLLSTTSKYIVTRFDELLHELLRQKTTTAATSLAESTPSPNSQKETYLHRSGRTARFGSLGWCVNVLFEGEEADHLSYFQMQLGFHLADYSDREEATVSQMSALPELQGQEE